MTGNYEYVHDMVFPKMLHARIIRPPNYFSKFIKFTNNIDQKINKLDIKIIVKNSFLAILSTDEYLVVKYLDIIKQNIVWEEVKKLSEDTVYYSLKNNDKESLLVKSGGEAFYENIPSLKEFKDTSFIF